MLECPLLPGNLVFFLVVLLNNVMRGVALGRSVFLPEIWPFNFLHGNCIEKPLPLFLELLIEIQA